MRGFSHTALHRQDVLKCGRLVPEDVIVRLEYASESCPGLDQGCIMSGRPDQAARTSWTSGTKWRRRFSMPFFSVAVEDGHPEQAPFISR